MGDKEARTQTGLPEEVWGNLATIKQSNQDKPSKAPSQASKKAPHSRMQL